MGDIGRERSEAGYQLLGGTAVPTPVYPSVMLGFQPWSKPNTFDTFNAGSHLERTLRPNWNKSPSSFRLCRRKTTKGSFS